MNNDLISRKALLDYLGKKFINVNYHPDLGDPAIGMEQELFNEFLADTLNEINEQPTAYDVDRVAGRLENACCKDIDNMELPIIDIEKVIEIVKGGGQGE